MCDKSARSADNNEKMLGKVVYTLSSLITPPFNKTPLLRKIFGFWKMDRIKPPTLLRKIFPVNHLMDLKFSWKISLPRHSIYLIHTAILHKARRKRKFFCILRAYLGGLGSEGPQKNVAILGGIFHFFVQKIKTIFE